MPEIISVTSEQLQAQIRTLLPSQQGFGDDLQATNLITPVIDLTAAAEGSSLPSDLQNAWDFATGSATVANTTTTVVNTTGFWKLNLVYTHFENGSGRSSSLFINDGASDKTIWNFTTSSASSAYLSNLEETFFIYLRAGDSIKATADNSCHMSIAYRQVATVTGVLVNPLGFTSE
jgi:hypothetical protein